MFAITSRFAVQSPSLKRRLASACILLAACYATPSAAEGAFERYQVTAEERAACTPDVLRLCASAIPSVNKIIACMKRERPRLSPACATAFDARVAKSKTASRAAPAKID
jgi:hypothetical protein